MAGQDSFGIQISLIARILRTRFDKRTRTLGLTQPQWRTIGAIHRHPGSTQRFIAEVLEVSTVTAGKILERLDASGWIERRPNQYDRRENLLFLKPSAAPMLEQLTTIGYDEEAKALAGMTVQECTMLSALLGKVMANLAKPCDDEALCSSSTARPPQCS